MSRGIGGLKNYSMNARTIKLTCRILLAALLFAGCSIQKLAVSATGSIIDNTLTAVYEESDLEIAKDSIAGFLKMIEGLLKSDPKNRRLLLRAAEGYTGYALGFVEDYDTDRAVVLYARARDYGLDLLSRNRELGRALDRNLDQLEAALSKTRSGDVPDLFWTANAWGSYIKLNPGDLSALAAMGKVNALMERVIELDEDFYFGTAHLFLGVIEIEKGIAGNTENAKGHFDRALEISDGRFLLTKVLYARHYAVRTFDEEIFVSTLQEVLESPGGILPEYRLINEIAKEKARLYLANKDEWF